MFDPARPDRTMLAKVPFGDAWLGLAGAPTDPREVRSRLAMYRLLVERGNGFRAFGPGDALAPWWGYAAQLAWQHASGRLGGDLIEPDSWWGACNYALSVIPYTAAARLGYVPAVPFDVEIAPYASALAAWHVALARAHSLRAGDDLEPARMAFWRAHVESIEIATARHHVQLAAMPTLEQQFARGWVRMVELFGAAGLRTDLTRLVIDDAGALPGQVLARPATLGALARAERKTARGVLGLAARPQWRWMLEVAAWKRMMRTRAARDEAETLIGGLLGGHRAVQLRALRYFAA